MLYDHFSTYVLVLWWLPRSFMTGGFEPLSPFESVSELLNSYVATSYLSKITWGVGGGVGNSYFMESLWRIRLAIKRSKVLPWLWLLLLELNGDWDNRVVQTTATVRGDAVLRDLCRDTLQMRPTLKNSRQGKRRSRFINIKGTGAGQKKTVFANDHRILASFSC